MDAAATPQYQSWLESFAAAQGGMAATVHMRRGEALELVAALNIPPPVVEAVRVVPRGKGMAGIALTTREPVQTCNLQTDESGRVQPGARSVPVRASEVRIVSGDGRKGAGWQRSRRTARASLRRIWAGRPSSA